MRADIIDIDHTGKGIAKVDNKITFISKAIPGDEVDVKIIKEKKNYNIGLVDRFINYSEDRVESSCPYYNLCGGCQISNLTYQKQLEYKVNKVKNIFNKYMGLDLPLEIISSIKEYQYRNKITYHCDKELGLVSITDDIIDIDSCLLVSSKINDLFLKIKKDDNSNLKKIIIREVSNGLVLIVYGELDVLKYRDDCIEIYLNDKLVYSKDKPYITINNIKYQISLNSFFQVNTSNISRLYDLILKYGNFSKEDEVIDLYCGVGSISLYVANYVKKVIGIEIVDNAIKDAKENAKINNINNTEFICSDVSKIDLSKYNASSVIVDPPRAGLDKNTINFLNNSKIEKIIYVSCDPITLVRDIKLLDNYTLEDITLVDMFPQTYHVESVVLLQRKD